MDTLQTALLTLQIIVAISLIILVLLQRSGSDSLGGISGSSSSVGSVMSGRAAANFLTKLTGTLIFIFMLNCLVLTALSKKKNADISSKLDQVVKEQEAKEQESKTPLAPPVE